MVPSSTDIIQQWGGGWGGGGGAGGYRGVMGVMVGKGGWTAVRVGDGGGGFYRWRVIHPLVRLRQQSYRPSNRSERL